MSTLLACIIFVHFSIQRQSKALSYVTSDYDVTLSKSTLCNITRVISTVCLAEHVIKQNAEFSLYNISE